MNPRRVLLPFLGLMGSVLTASAETPVTDATAVASRYQEVLQRDEYHQRASSDFFAQLSHWIVTLLQSLQDSFQHYEYSAQLVRLSYALMSAIFVLGVASLFYWSLKIFRQRYTLAAANREKTVGRRIDNPESFEPEIAHAVTAQLWTTALQLSWRHFLTLLERHELVPADRTRTNWEYLRQLEQSPAVPVPLRQLCRELVIRYDHYIYGSQRVSSEDWAQWNASVEALIRTLKLHRPTTP